MLRNYFEIRLSSEQGGDLWLQGLKHVSSLRSSGTAEQSGGNA